MTNAVLRVALFMFLFFLPMAVTSRGCYECESSHSFQDCDAHRQKSTCLHAQRCVKVVVHKKAVISGEGYVRACAKTCSASDVRFCSNPDYTCDVIECCSSDFCNGATGPVVKGILLIASITASLIYLIFH